MVVVACATHPLEELRLNQAQVASPPWCEDETCVLGWGVVMHQVMVWAIAADHHGALGIAFSSATRCDFFTH